MIPEYTLVVGIDVSANEDMKGKNVVGVVASVNKNFTRYYSRTYVQDKGKEMIENFGVVMAEIVNAYKQINSRLPGKIIILRNGITQTNYSGVLTDEIPPMQAEF